MTSKIIEEWRPVPGYEGLYEASNTGKVASLNYNGTGARRELKPIKKHHGYMVVRLYRKGEWKAIRLHRVIAKTFIPNAGNLPEINHIDEDPSNNAVSNLEWCTHKYNSTYGGHNKRISEALTNGKLSKAVVATLPDGTVERYPSQAEAKRVLGCAQSGISRACLGSVEYFGRRWSFAD